MIDKIRELKNQYAKARNDKQREAVDTQMQILLEQNPDAFSQAMIALASDTADEAEELSVREQLNDILPAVSLAYIAKTYFGKTRQWLYQRINGSVVNGKAAKLSADERAILDHALKDIGNKLCSTNVSS